MGFELYIFDLDGTLVDSAGDICAATVQTICEFAPAAGAAGVPCAAALYGIGDPDELKALGPPYLLKEFSGVLACKALTEGA